MFQSNVLGTGLLIHQVQTVTLQAALALICGSLGRGVKVKWGNNPQQSLPGIAGALCYVLCYMAAPPQSTHERRS